MENGSIYPVRNNPPLRLRGECPVGISNGVYSGIRAIDLVPFRLP
jgi:hypothetical protein